MNTKQAHPVIDQLQAAGLNMSLGDDGKVFVNNPAHLTDELHSLIREHKPLLIDWLRAANDPAPEVAADPEPAANDAQPGTQRPDDLPPKLLAASQALDAQIVAAGMSLTPPEQPKPKLATVNKSAQAADAPKPKPTKHVEQDWKPLALAYHVHHFKCPVCIVAGKGTRYGPRCGVGAALWTGYQNAIQ